MPPKRYKCVAKRYKKNLEEDQSSNPPIELDKPDVERTDSLVRGIHPVEDAPLLIENAPPEDHSDDLFWNNYRPPEVDSESEEMVSLRHCIACDRFGCKEDMARCRGECGYWYHTECAKEPDRQGKDDPNFSFWLCPKCKPDPKANPSHKLAIYSKEEIEKDKHFEDSDYELEPDYRMWK